MTAPILTLSDVQIKALETHGFTLANGEPENPKWDDVRDRDGDLTGWDIWVADGQVCAFVPQFPRSTGEVSDGGPLTDWRDAICAAGVLMLGAHADLLHLHAEVARLTAELGKPVAGAWVGNFRPSERGYTVAETGAPGCGWHVWHNTGGPAFATGPETGDAGKHAADLALVAAGYRLVGGVFGEVSDG